MDIAATNLLSVGPRPSGALLFKHGCETYNAIVHIANEIVPVVIVINETSSINVKLIYRLESPVHLLKILRICFDLYNFKCFIH